jgi:hypothetical protein
MPKKLSHKNCVICGIAVEGKKRADRNSYYYPKRCSNCAFIPEDPNVTVNRLKWLEQARAKHEKPIGSRRKHEASPGMFYWLIKVKPTGRWQYEHRVVTKAPKGFHVHHINGNTLDNRLENLAVLSPKEHLHSHNSLHGKWAKLFDSCTGCGTTTKRHLSHGLCTTCYQKPRS